MTARLTRRAFTSLAAAFPFSTHARAAANWDSVLLEAKGQTVYFNAWAGSEPINAYIAWAGEQLKARHGIVLEHVKISDAAEVVRRVRDEVKAGKAQGSVDLVWINGENFRAMKQDGLLFGPFAESLPNFALVDTKGKPTTLVDFAEPTDGYESPWGMAQLTFFGDGTAVDAPPLSMMELLDRAKLNPGGITYPAPPDFHGTTFVKQVLAETIADRALLTRPIGKEDFAGAAKPMFEFLDRLHEHLWREGRQFPLAQAQVTQMLQDNELLLSLTFNPSEPANLVAAGKMPRTTIAWQHKAGTIGNTHFVAIPINAQSKAAAQVTADFLLSPQAQARKADIKVWGDPTVLDATRLRPEEASAFAPAAGPGAVSYPAPAIPEPHGSWVPLIEAAWLERYGA
jgi:putative thiamine transport system substrate-binding protein